MFIEKFSNWQDVIPFTDESLSYGPLLNHEEYQPEQPPQSQEQHSIPVSCVRRPPDRFQPDS